MAVVNHILFQYNVFIGCKKRKADNFTDYNQDMPSSLAIFPCLDLKEQCYLYPLSVFYLSKHERSYCVSRQFRITRVLMVNFTLHIVYLTGCFFTARDVKPFRYYQAGCRHRSMCDDRSIELINSTAHMHERLHTH
jgi:hypothetical protein